jgi:hypothetical protein
MSLPYSQEHIMLLVEELIACFYYPINMCCISHYEACWLYHHCNEMMMCAGYITIYLVLLFFSLTFYWWCVG